jgi:DUF4097 and DUF4098 domain-containing protein YvlB
MATISINGTSFSISGVSVHVVNGKVYADGKRIGEEDKNVDIKIEGYVHNLKVDVCNKFALTGNADKIETVSGDVQVNGDVHSISTISGDVYCGDVSGNAKSTSGAIFLTKKTND